MTPRTKKGEIGGVIFFGKSETEFQDSQINFLVISLDINWFHKVRFWKKLTGKGGSIVAESPFRIIEFALAFLRVKMHSMMY